VGALGLSAFPPFRLSAFPLEHEEQQHSRTPRASKHRGIRAPEHQSSSRTSKAQVLLLATLRTRLESCESCESCESSSCESLILNLESLSSICSPTHHIYPHQIKRLSVSSTLLCSPLSPRSPYPSPTPPTLFRPSLSS